MRLPGAFGERRGHLRTAEDAVVALALALIVLLPLTEVALRRFQLSISGSTPILQHLTLIIGVLGGALAAREGRLLALSTGEILPKGIWKLAARFVSNSIAAAISAFLCAAAVAFVRAEREAGAILAYGVPVWVVQCILPLGFGLIALRLILHSGRPWASAILAAAIVVAGFHPPLPPAQLAAPALVALVIATALGTPLFTTLGGAALILFWGDGLPVASIPIDHYRLVTNPTLPAIPLFTLAGYFLAEGSASRRLIRVFHAWFGGFRGGPAIVTALVCAFFTSFTGASGVTILALSGLLMPVLLSARYSEKNALGLLTGAGSLGLLFPPCLPLILYAIVAKVQMEQMFLGGILPGVLLVGLTAWWGVRCGPRLDSMSHFDWREACASVRDAKWELLLPFVALVGLFAGFATPVEAAAVTALYAFAIEAFVHRDLKPMQVVHVMAECGLVVGGVLLILGVALGFTNYLVDAQIPMRLVEWATASIHSPWLFLLLLNAFLLVVGCLMDIFSAILVVVPLIVPLGEAFHIDPVHLGIVFLANLELGYLTPPVGLNLFLASYRLGKPMSEIYRSVVPMLLVLLVGVLLITYIPWLTTVLPRLAR